MTIMMMMTSVCMMKHLKSIDSNGPLTNLLT